MTHFLKLPPELLPVIFDFVLRPQHIYRLCLVNKTFNRFATPLLYRRVFIFAWHREAKTKVGLGLGLTRTSHPITLCTQVILLFRTLSECPHLACYVKKLGQLSGR